MHIFPLRLCILLAAWTRVLVSATDVFWWFELRVDTAAKVNQCVDFINTHRNVVQGVYVFVDGSVDVNGNWIAPDPANVSATIGPILSTGVEVGLAVNLAPQDGSVMMSGNAPKAAAPMASWLSSINGATRLMLDYEPTAQITDQHRQNYAAVLSAFSQAAHGVGKQVDTCVGGSDFLEGPNNDFSMWAKTGVDRLQSMGITYKNTEKDFDINSTTPNTGDNSLGNNKDIPKGEDAVRQMLSQMSHAQVNIGIGSMVSPASAATWDYKWDKSTLNDFVEFLKKKSIQHVSVFRADIENTDGTTEEWFLNAIGDLV